MGVDAAREDQGSRRGCLGYTPCCEGAGSDPTHGGRCVAATSAGLNTVGFQKGIFAGCLIPRHGCDVAELCRDVRVPRGARLGAVTWIVTVVTGTRVAK